jgi:hypothetical protein
MDKIVSCTETVLLTRVTPQKKKKHKRTHTSSRHWLYTHQHKHTHTNSRVVPPSNSSNAQVHKKSTRRRKQKKIGTLVLPTMLRNKQVNYLLYYTHPHTCKHACLHTEGGAHYLGAAAATLVTYLSNGSAQGPAGSRRCHRSRTWRASAPASSSVPPLHPPSSPLRWPASAPPRRRARSR